MKSHRLLTASTALLCLLTLFAGLCCPALAEGADTWVCPKCETVNSGAYCMECDAPRPSSAVYLDGKKILYLTVSLKKNRIFSRYDVDIFVDDRYVGDVAQGGTFSQTFSVSAGVHVIRFAKAGDPSRFGIAQVEVKDIAALKCEIESKMLEVRVLDKQVGTGPDRMASFSAADYMASCIPADYERFARYPDQNRGYFVKLEGRVAAIGSAVLNTDVYIIKDSRGNLWYCRMYPRYGQRRFLVNDWLTVYGEADGKQSYTVKDSGEILAPVINIEYAEF